MVPLNMIYMTLSSYFTFTLRIFSYQGMKYTKGFLESFQKISDLVNIGEEKKNNKKYISTV